MKKMVTELKGVYFQMGHSGYVGLYWGSSCHIYQLIQHCKIHYGKKGTYIRYNRTTYYFD